MINLSWTDVTGLARRIANNLPQKGPAIIYGVPRGGVYAAILVQSELARLGRKAILTEEPGSATLFVDDIIDSGTIRDRMVVKKEEGFPFFGQVTFEALVDKLGKDNHWKEEWISFPWERMTNDDGPVENIRRLIEYIGDDPKREGLLETPDRVIKSYEKLFGGYDQSSFPELKIFKDDCDEMVLLKDIEFYSTCEHHMLPFFGKAHIAYIPNGKVIGVSKLARILEFYSRRLQIQERICQQVTHTINKALGPLGVGCVLEAQHFCMTSRGVEKQNSIMVTSSLTGVFKDCPGTRSEFMNRIG